MTGSEVKEIVAEGSTKHSTLQVLKIPVVLSIYSMPAVAIAFRWSLSRWFLETLLLLPLMWVVMGIMYNSDSISASSLSMDLFENGRWFKLKRWAKILLGFPESGKWKNKWKQKFESSQDSSESYKVEKANISTLDLEYESLISEAQYRDKLLLQTTYFAIGVIGLFAGILSRDIPHHHLPIVPLIASVAMFSFAIAANSYKDSRDALWARIGYLERKFSESDVQLTTYRTIREMDLRLFNTLSLSTYSVGLTTFFTIITYAAYVWAVLYIN